MKRKLVREEDKISGKSVVLDVIKNLTMNLNYSKELKTIVQNVLI